jgi:hypothetical protein
MSRLLNLTKALRGFLGQTTDKPVSLVAERFLLAFREHGIEAAQIPRLLPEIRLDDLQSPDQLLTRLTPDLLDQVAKLFGIRVQWLEGCDDRIYDGLATYKEPQRLLDHLRSLWHHISWANEVGTPLRILSTTKKLDYRDDHRYELAPILVEPIAKLGEETIYRYHVYQDGFSWNHQPARIELKAIATVAYKAMHKPIPIYAISPQDMDALLEGRQIPRSLLGTCLSTNPSLEDYALDGTQSVVAKEADELPAVLKYMARTGLDTYDFSAPVSNLDDAPDPESAGESSSNTPPPPLAPVVKGKRQLHAEIWKDIRTAATTLWAQDQTTNITEMIFRLKRIPSLKAVAHSDSAIRKHIDDLAPEGIRGKPGRKPKKST